jgi:5-methylthioadenosine/S-adenosylhomocysteine deaminase
MMVNQTGILITGGTVLTMNDGGDIIENGAVAIADGKIVAVGSASELSGYNADETMNAKGKLIMPGLINGHTHMPMSVFRGLADDLPLEKWLQETIFPAEAQFISPATVDLGARLAIAEMLLSGTTTCCDGYFLADRIALAVKDSGMRAVLGQGVIDFPAPGVPDPKQNVTAAAGFVRDWQVPFSRITPSIFCHSPYTCSPETLQAAKAAANQLDALFQIHVAETRTEMEQCRKTYGCSPVQHLAKLGVLDHNTILVHAVWVDDADMEEMARSQAGTVHCPESNMKLAAGVAPVPQMHKHGIAMGLGTDGCASNNDLDLFGEMDSAAKLHKIHQVNPTTMNARKVVRMATIEGAAVLGLDSMIGSLETGKQADLIIIDLARPHLVPMYRPESHLVYTVKGSDVQHVMVAGQWVVRNQRLLTLDTDLILKEARSLAVSIAQLQAG